MNATILIVDDDHNVLNSLERLLRRDNYEIIKAVSGDSALEAMRNYEIAVIICDQRMPHISGDEVFRESIKINPNTVRITLTGYSDLNAIIQLVNEGHISHFLLKPWNDKVLRCLVKDSVAQYQLIGENRRLHKLIKSQNKELKEKNKRLGKLDKLKSEFVVNVSHELKNPLAIIHAYMEFILEDNLNTSDSTRKMIKAGKQALDRLIRLVTDLLDISTIESGKIKLKKVRVDIKLLLEEISAAYEKNLFDKQIALEKEVLGDKMVIRADKDKLTQIIINLLNNAIKYTPAGGTVTVRIGIDKQEARFEISDTGPGIPEEYLHKIFDKYERITAEKKEGTGLGLSIVKEIVELHKGRIWVESEFKKGSKFIFTLPQQLSKVLRKTHFKKDKLRTGKRK